MVYLKKRHDTRTEIIVQALLLYCLITDNGQIARSNVLCAETATAAIKSKEIYFFFNSDVDHQGVVALIKRRSFALAARVWTLLYVTLTITSSTLMDDTAFSSSPRQRSTTSPPVGPVPVMQICTD